MIENNTGQPSPDSIDTNLAKVSKSIHTMQNLCAKQNVLAVLITLENEIFWSHNSCDAPQVHCPRGDKRSGEGYDLCSTICAQTAHAEVNVCLLAGEKAVGARVDVFGHTYSCDNCREIMKESGIRELWIHDSQCLNEVEVLEFNSPE